MTGINRTDPAWLTRVQATIERLRKKVIAEPDEMYFQLCLRGWEAELERIERRESSLSKESLPS
jgi:hypothetical protein